MPIDVQVLVALDKQNDVATDARLFNRCPNPALVGRLGWICEVSLDPMRLEVGSWSLSFPAVSPAFCCLSTVGCGCGPLVTRYIYILLSIYIIIFERPFVQTCAIV